MSNSSFQNIVTHAIDLMTKAIEKEKSHKPPLNGT